jgi:hypothetical protein
MAFTCTSIVGPSIAKNPSYSEYTFDTHKFILQSNDFNYYYYLDQKYIESISYVDDNEEEIKIKLNRYKIRDCDNRFIYINLVNNTITHYRVPLIKRKYLYYNDVILNDTELKFIPIEDDKKYNCVKKKLYYIIVIMGGIFMSYYI